MFPKLSLLILLFAAQTAFAASTVDPRCPDDVLDVSSAFGRLAWAMKCYPFKVEISEGDFAVIQDGILSQSYPIFGDVDATGRRTNLWHAPTDSNASCEDAHPHSFFGICTAHQNVGDEK